MSSIRVSVLLPAVEHFDAATASTAIAKYLESTGFAFEIVPLPASETYGGQLRRGVLDAAGDVIVVADGDLSYATTALGDAIAMIDSGATDVVFATGSSAASNGIAYAPLRWILGSALPDPTVRLKAFSSAAARFVIGETRMKGRQCDLEIAFLVNKYGFRFDTLHIEAAPLHSRSFSPLSVTAAFAIRLANRRMAYRPARRCPVCFSSDVWTVAQVPGNVIRACSRCKCRYLNQFTDEDDTLRVRRVFRPPTASSAPQEETHSETARERTSARRLALVHRYVPPKARLLEIGVRDGSFGVAASRAYEYVGIDHSPAIVRAARGRGLEAYCGTLGTFVNTGPSFDAIALHHVFENMPDPHDALARMKDLLKPGGALFLTTFDTEGLFYLMTGRARMRQNFRNHLILYSRSAMIELLEHSGFEIEVIGADFEYRDHRLLRHWLASKWPRLAPIGNALLRILRDPLLVSSGSIRIVAKRRAGAPFDMRAIRSAEPTHAR